MNYDGSPSGTPPTAMRLTKAYLTPTQSPVLDQGNSTKQKEGAKPLSGKKTRKSTHQKSEPPQQVLGQQELETGMTDSIKSQTYRRQQTQAKEIAHTNSSGRAVIAHAKGSQEEIDSHSR